MPWDRRPGPRRVPASAPMSSSNESQTKQNDQQSQRRRRKPTQERDTKARRETGNQPTTRTPQRSTDWQVAGDLRWACRKSSAAAPVVVPVIDVASLHDPDYHLREVTHDPSAYYLRQGEAPGRWRGFGATAMGLAGEVQPQALHRLFDGKHPAPAVYLISSKGSSARANARDRERWVDVKAAAASLSLS